MKRYITLLSALVVMTSLSAQVTHIYQVPYASQEVIIDGCESAPWAKSSWSTNFLDIVSEQPGKYKTNFKALWDREYLYFYFKLHDDDIKAKGTIDHEPLFSFDNVIEIFLDPGADQKNYYELQINAMGTRWELTLDKPYKDGGVATSPDELTGLVYAIQLEGTLNQSDDTDRYWTIEMKIPWTAIPDITDVPPTEELKVDFSRVYQDDDDIDTPPQYWLWAPIGESNIHIPERWGTLVFLKE